MAFIPPSNQLYPIIFEKASTVDHTLAADASTGDFLEVGSRHGVVISSNHGVNPPVIPSGSVVTLQVEGVATIPKATGAGTAVADGGPVYFSAVNEVTGVAGTEAELCGYGVGAALDGDAFCTFSILKR